MAQPRQELRRQDILLRGSSILQHLTGQIVFLIVAVWYVHACGRPDSVRPHYDPNTGAVGVRAEWKFKRSTEHVS